MKGKRFDSRLSVFPFGSLLIWSVKEIGSAVAAPTDIGDYSSAEAFWNSNYALPVGLLAVVASLVVLSMALMVCMDCMNSEVSSESHPASMSATPKWGGATNYHRGGQGEGGTDSCFISEEVNINDHRNAPLPYSMVPTQIPEAGEFRGYQTGTASQVQSGMVGYSSPNASAPSMAGYSANYNATGHSTNNSGSQGRHYNPAERDDPPPAYSEAAGH